MTSEERRIGRRQRREKARQEKKKEFLEKHNDFNLLIDLDNLYNAYKLSRKNVGWKESIQRYETQVLLNLLETKEKLIAGESVQRGFVEFILRERGKIRHIRAVHISERVVQRCFCDQVLSPLFTKSLIYDNGASIKGKGISFSKNRAKTHLNKYYNKNKTNKGYVLSIDFSKYFDSIKHDVLFNKARKYLKDDKIFKLFKDFISVFGDNQSLGLGSQVSQVSALLYINSLDHYCKEVLRLKYYGRYMDDSYAIHESKEYLIECLEKIEKECKKIGVTVNRKKTKISTLEEGFVFLKGKYRLLESGKILCIARKDGAKRMKRKLRKFHKKVQAGEMKAEDVYTSYQSFRSHLIKFNNYHLVKRMDAYYNRLFIFNNTLYEEGANNGKGISRNQGR